MSVRVFSIKDKFDDSSKFNFQTLYQHKNEPVYHVVHFHTQLALGGLAGLRKYPYALIAICIRLNNQPLKKRCASDSIIKNRHLRWSNIWKAKGECQNIYVY